MTVVSSAFACKELRLRQFRNFSELDVRVPAAGVAVVGDNGSGKSNLLEALYYLEIFRSFRGATDEQLVRFGADALFIRGRFEEIDSGRVHEIAAAYEPRTRRKRVAVDGVEPDRLADAIGRLGAVIFSPRDMAIVGGPPAERRRFLDIVLSLNRRGYLDALQRYRQALRQRNALLRAGADAAALSVWDDALVDWGSRITAARAEWTAAHAAPFARGYAEIGGGLPARLVYDPAVTSADGAPATESAIAQAFGEALRRVGARERERGLTLAGPHRDDLLMLTTGADGEIDLRDYGSGGQLRTAAIALRMIEAQTIREARGRPPLILLDDVFAELDAGRSRRVLSMLDASERGQVILTAPKPVDLGAETGARFASSLEQWHIDAGRITP